MLGTNSRLGNDMESTKLNADEAAMGKVWIEPSIRSLDVSETGAFPNNGADARGNPNFDSQRS